MRDWAIDDSDVSDPIATNPMVKDQKHRQRDVMYVEYKVLRLVYSHPLVTRRIAVNMDSMKLRISFETE